MERKHVFKIKKVKTEAQILRVAIGLQAGFRFGFEKTKGSQETNQKTHNKNI